MNRTDRALYSRIHRHNLEKLGYKPAPDDDGVTWSMRVGDWLQEKLSTLFVLIGASMFCAFLGVMAGAPLLGFIIGLFGSALGLLQFKHRPPLGPVGRHIDRLGILAGIPPYDAQIQQSIRNAAVNCVAVIIYAGIGAIVAALLGVPAVIGAFGAGIAVYVFAWKDAAQQEPLERDNGPDHRGVQGEAEAATCLEQFVEAGLSIDGGGGFFIGTWTLDTWHRTKRRFRRAVWNLIVKTHFLSFDQETGGVILYAPPGSGKGTSFCLTALLWNRRDTIVCVDPASQNFAVSRAWLEADGVEVHRFDPTGAQSASLGPSAQCNPLGSKDINSPTTEAEVQEDAAIIARIREGDNQSYFSASAQTLVFAVALFLLEVHGAKATWPMVAEMLHLPLERFNDLLRDMTRSRFASVRHIAHKFFVPFDEEGKPTRYLTQAMQNVIENAQQETAFLSTAGIARMFSGNSCVVADGKKRRKAFFVCIADNESVPMQKCTHLLLATMKRQLCTAGGLTTLWVIDEMCSSLSRDASVLVQSLFNTARKFRNRVAGICQSYGQYLAWCGSEHQAHALRAAAGACIYYGANDPETIAEIQREAGQCTVWQPSTSPLAEHGIGGSTTPIGVDLLTPEALRDQHRNGGQTIFLMGSRRCVIGVPRVPYFEIPELAARASPDPYHQ